MNANRIWAYGVVGFFLLLLLIDGIAVQIHGAVWLPPVLGLIFLVFGTWRLRLGLPSRMAGLGLLLLVSGVVLLGLQLVPLPPALWSLLPGRQFVQEALTASGASPGWMPLSLSPQGTRAALLSLIPAIALFVVGLTLSPVDRRFVALGLLVIAVASVLLGLAQKFNGAGNSFSFFEEYSGSVTGAFANRNFFAAQLYTSIPFLAALAIAWVRQREANRLVIAVFAFIYLVVVIAGLGATGSRAGTALAMAAVLVSGLLLWGKSRVHPASPPASRLAAFGLFAILFLVAQLSLVGVMRIAETDPVNDYRTVIYAVSLHALGDFFPAGSGFGSFVPIYALYETPATMLDNYVNHAHNDWLELALEGGLPIVLLLAAFLVWFVLTAVGLWRMGSHDPESLIPRAAALAAGLLMLHSLVDYPLRTRALMGLFALCCGLMASGLKSSVANQRRRASEGQVSAAPEISPAPIGERRKGPYFVPKSGSKPTG